MKAESKQAWRLMTANLLPLGSLQAYVFPGSMLLCEYRIGLVFGDEVY